MKPESNVYFVISFWCLVPLNLIYVCGLGSIDFSINIYAKLLIPQNEIKHNNSFLTRYFGLDSRRTNEKGI